MIDLDEALTVIARKHLGIPSLQARNSDLLDFHDVAVWQLRHALKEAFDLGRMTGDKVAEPCCGINSAQQSTTNSKVLSVSDKP